MERLKKGDTVCCDSYDDLRDMQRTLSEQGYVTKTDVGYTLRIISAPMPDRTEQDRFITKKQTERREE